MTTDNGKPTLVALGPDDDAPPIEWKVVADRAPYVKFTEPGQTVQGRFLGLLTEQSQYGDVMVAYVASPDGTRRFYATIELRSKLVQVPLTSLVKITYMGQAASSRKERRKLFAVEVACARPAK